MNCDWAYLIFYLPITQRNMYIFGAVLILSWWWQQNSLLCVCVYIYTEDVPIEFMSLVLTHMPGDSYCRQLP